MSHSILTNESDDTVASELLESKNALEKIVGKGVDMISYPNGNYSDKVIAFARSAGYEIACTTVRGRVGRRVDRMALPRIDLLESDVGDKNGNFANRMFEWISR